MYLLLVGLKALNIFKSNENVLKSLSNIIKATIFFSKELKIMKQAKWPKILTPKVVEK